VELSLCAVDDHAHITVRDTGAGIDAALLPKIFDPFVQGDQTLARSGGGLGLGLALVRGISELHGGSVRAESAGVGKGAELVVVLPTVAAPVHAIERAGARQDFRPRRVLVVDDDRDGAESLADVVEMLGHAAEVAYDGPSALEKARANPPEIVLCDIGLPGMSGYEIAKALRAASAEMQLYAVSGYAQSEDVRRAVEAGFDGHLAKPVDVDDIARLLG
jgi:CheY-like chemotaxis protein